MVSATEHGDVRGRASSRMRNSATNAPAPWARCRSHRDVPRRGGDRQPRPRRAELRPHARAVADGGHTRHCVTHFARPVLALRAPRLAGALRGQGCGGARSRGGRRTGRARSRQVGHDPPRGEPPARPRRAAPSQRGWMGEPPSVVRGPIATTRWHTPTPGKAFPGGEIHLNVPNLGDPLGARVAAEIGDHIDQLATASSPQSCSGTAPVARESGTSLPVVSQRLARSRFVRDAVQSGRSARSRGPAGPASSTTGSGEPEQATTSSCGRSAVGGSRSAGPASSLASPATTRSMSRTGSGSPRPRGAVVGDEQGRAGSPRGRGHRSRLLDVKLAPRP